MDGTGNPVDQTVAFSFPILPNPAETPLPFGKNASSGTEVTLNLSSTQASKIGGKLGPDESFFGHLCSQGPRMAEKMNNGKGTQTLSTNLQELSFGQMGAMQTFTVFVISHVDLETLSTRFSEIKQTNH